MYGNGNTIKIARMACAAAKAKTEKPPLTQLSHGTVIGTATQAYIHRHTQGRRRKRDDICAPKTK